MKPRNPPHSPPPPEAVAMLAEYAGCEDFVFPYEPAREQIAHLYPLVEAALAHTKQLRCPVIITTPEFSDYVVRLDLPPGSGT